MLSPEAVQFLQALEYHPDAERLGSIMPLGGIYWADEIPDFQALFALGESHRNLVLRLFGIRFKIRNGDELDPDDQRFWECANSQVPDCPIFRRTELSAEDRAAQQAVEEEALAAVEALCSDANKVTINEDGSFTATFDLAERQSKPWWRRLLAWCRSN